MDSILNSARVDFMLSLGYICSILSEKTPLILILNYQIADKLQLIGDLQSRISNYSLLFLR